jgi:hypothetical protein
MRKLTDEEWAAAEKYREVCRQKALSTEPMDKEKAMENISFLYHKMGWETPTFHFFASPNCAKEWIMKEKGAKYLNTNFYGNQEMYWIGFLMFGREKLGIDFGAEKNHLLEIWNNIADACGWWFVIDDKTCLICDRHSEFHLDDQNRLHNPSGYAMAYRDGFGVCVYNGMYIPEDREWWILDNSKITIEAINNEENADYRRIMIDIMGQSNYLFAMDMELVDGDYIKITNDPDSASMPRFLMKSKLDGTQYLVGTDGSTNRVYYMEVDPDTKTCIEAHNSISPIPEYNILASS